MIRGKTYDVLKMTAQIYLPALGTLYAALALVWGLPHPAEVGATVLAVDTFLGAILKLSSVRYDNSDEKYDGELEVVETDEGSALKLKSVDYHALNTKSEFLFKVHDREPRSDE